MTRVGRAGMMLFLGLTMARLLWTGSFGWFIQQRMAIPLALATVVLLGLGAYEAVQGTREEQRDESAARRSVAPRVGWMMVLPLLVLVSVAPTGLGAAAADRVEAYTPPETTVLFQPLDLSQEPVEMRVFDFVDRAIWDDEKSISGLTVQLEGLVVNDETVDDGFLLTRFLVSCCAADGVPIQVAIRGVEQSYPDDTWVVLEVEWIEPGVEYVELPINERVVEARVLSLTVDPDPPTNAYESPY